MRLILIFYLVILTFITHSQSFYFQEHETTLIKTTEQTPAHWYLEIFSNLNKDTTLRWKSMFENIPNQWEIGFDTQAGSVVNIEHGDSADFTLMHDLTFPQKLIISAATNDTPGDGTVSFEIFDPENPVFRDTIHYHFKITQALGIKSFNNEIYEIKSNEICVLNDEKTQICISNSTGKIIYSTQDFRSYKLSQLPPNNYYFFSIIQNKNQFLFKMYLD